MNAVFGVSLDTIKEKFNPRRPFPEKWRSEYMEPDRDFVLNNFDLCLEILEGMEEVKNGFCCVT